MDDKELQMLAAKAAGIKAKWFKVKKYRETKGARWGCGTTDVFGTHHSKPWRPLNDAGDRHRLLIELKMTLANEPNRGGWSAGAVVGGEFRWLAFHEDEARAIVLAAAEIGKAMP